MKGLLNELWLLIATSLVLVSCGGSKAKEGYVELHLEGLSASSPAYLYSYTSQRIQVDTLPISAEGTLDFSKEVELDTVDILLLKDAEGRLILPLLPDRESGRLGAYLQKEKALELDGVLASDTITKWYALAQGDLSSLIPFIQAQTQEPLPTLFALDALQRRDGDSCREELEGVLNQSDYRSYEWNNLLGIALVREQHMQAMVGPMAPTFINIEGEEEAKNLVKLMGKKPLMAINLFRAVPTDTLLMKRQKRYLHLLDSLSIPSYNLLLNDTLPTGFTPKKKEPWRYFLLNNKGKVQHYIQSRRLTELPTFQLVDSTLTVWRTWHNPDSLVQFVEAYHVAKKKGHE